MGASVLFLGDLVGAAGRRALLHALPGLRARLEPTFVVVNGENVAGGLGITERLATEVLAAGVDVITLGNHAFHRRESWAYLDRAERVVRPANFLTSMPGRGRCVVERDGVRLGVLNLMGNVHLDPGRHLWTDAETEVGRLEDEGVDLLLVDLHAEVTSEKVGLGWELDGRATAVVGTHTHVPTADARVLPGGTAYVTDVGMCGARDSVIGARRDRAVAAMRTKLHHPLEPAEGDPWVMGVLVRAAEDRPRAASSIEQILEPVPSAAR